jgi:hypothetical protein
LRGHLSACVSVAPFLTTFECDVTLRLKDGIVAPEEIDVARQQLGKHSGVSMRSVLCQILGLLTKGCCFTLPTIKCLSLFP